MATRLEEITCGFLILGVVTTCVGERELFSQLDNNFREKVKLGNIQVSLYKGNAIFK
jgi:hypothetical protein